MYDPLGIISPVLVRIKVLFQELCEKKVGWDEQLKEGERKRWIRWLDDLRSAKEVAVPRCVYPMPQGKINCFLHGFADTSIKAYCAVVYFVCSKNALKGDTKITKNFSVLGIGIWVRGVPKTQGYPNHCDTATKRKAMEDLFWPVSAIVDEVLLQGMDGHIRQMMALPFLPHETTAATFNSLKPEANMEPLPQFVSYIRKTGFAAPFGPPSAGAYLCSQSEQTMTLRAGIIA